MEYSTIKQPNVIVKQVIETNNPQLSTPLLVPFITGVCREIIKAQDSTGSWNLKSKYSAPYTQLPKVIPYLSFPSPRNNIDQVTIEPNYLRVFDDFSAQVNELSKTSNFLMSYNNATRACIRSDVEPGGGGWDLNPVGGAKTLILAMDQTVSALSTKDISVTFTSIANAKLSTQQVCDQINTALGITVATAITLTGETSPRLQILSLGYGADSSITIRGGGTANTVLGFATQTERVEGSGFRGQDQFNGTTKTIN
jgi:hypothetical protein